MTGLTMNFTGNVLPYKKIPILLYHQIAATTAEEEYHRLAVPPETFDAQLKYYHDRGYTSTNLDELCGSDGGSQKYEEKKIVITFDDGYLDTYTVAFPILEKYGYTATIFLISDFIGKSHAWNSCEQFPYMHWSHAREMMSRGFLFGSHTCTHPDLTLLEEKEITQELLVSRKKIEDNLGIPVKHFSYPFGNYNYMIKECVKNAGYEKACSVSITDNDCLSMERFMIHLKDNYLRFIIKSSRWSSWLRRASNFRIYHE
jgi:peptidoglycan/xylan/chitin deacetylase (PgdA/CDA1 family)